MVSNMNNWSKKTSDCQLLRINNQQSEVHNTILQASFF